MNEKEVKKPFYKRWWFIGLMVAILLGGIEIALEDDEEIEEPIREVVAEEEEIQEEPEEVEEKVDLAVTGKVDVEFKDGKAIVTVTTNAIDGSMFEVALLDNEFNTVSEFITVENGVAKADMEEHEEWQPGCIEIVALMRFDLDDAPQPDNVKAIYGEVGENLEGGLRKENTSSGYNIALKTESAPYPNKESAQEEGSKILDEAIQELISTSEGIITDIQPADEAWNIIRVTISDAWYNSEDHEKERFAEQVSDTVQSIVKNSGKVKSDEIISVVLIDTYSKELATPKVLGGYKIKR